MRRTFSETLAAAVLIAACGCLPQICPVLSHTFPAEIYSVPVSASLNGFDETHRVTGVTFDNVTVNGRKIRSAADLKSLAVAHADQPTFR